MTQPALHIGLEKEEKVFVAEWRRSTCKGMTPAAPKIDARVAPAGVSLGAQLSLYDSSQWEEFITEWMEGFEPRYHHAERLAGPGDKGRDIVGYHSAPGPKATWDNYQCKHYAAPLQPS